ncbi:MAG: CDP-alcohol phosphatidyltransferase family protein, partial [Myxococcota bacterium]|nr:CDP-alcohol phosphatidyltransferase family protein [Myxococcota bacterium]
AGLHAALRDALGRPDPRVDVLLADPASDRGRVVDLLSAEGGGDVLLLRADVVLGRAVSGLLGRAAVSDGKGVLLVDPEARGVRGPERTVLGEGRAPWIGAARLPPAAAADVVEALAADRSGFDDLRFPAGSLPASGAAVEVAAVGAGSGGVTGPPWQPVRDDADAGNARRLLFRSLGKPQDGIVSRYMNRPISIAISRLLVDLPVHPNLVTIAVSLIGLAGCVAVAVGDAYWWPLVGTALVHVASILDGCDGELARLRHQQSHLGAWLDTVTDEATVLLYAACVGINLWRFEQSPLLAAVCVATLLCGGAAIYVCYSYLVSIGSGNSQDFPSGAVRASAATGRWAKLIGFLAYLPKRDTTNLAMLACAAAGQLWLCQVFIFIGASIMCVVYVRQHIRIRRGLIRVPVRGGAGGR